MHIQCAFKNIQIVDFLQYLFKKKTCRQKKIIWFYPPFKFSPQFDTKMGDNYSFAAFSERAHVKTSNYSVDIENLKKKTNVFR